ncbi:hypothetical protein [Sphingobacterium detergens]
MTNIGDIYAFGYGISVISTDLLTEYLKENKCKAKKLLTYLDKNKDFFHQMIKDGRILPFYQIPMYNYQIFVSINELETNIPKDYKKIFQYDNFFIEVGQLNKICFTNLDYLEHHLGKIKQNITEDFKTIPSGSESIPVKCNYAIGFELPKGKYEFDIIGLKRQEETKNESKNLAYMFTFRKNDNAINENFEKGDNEKSTFDIGRYEKNYR